MALCSCRCANCQGASSVILPLIDSRKAHAHTRVESAGIAAAGRNRLNHVIRFPFGAIARSHSAR
eukprot:2952226-Pyramimonas_sp.AAC.1